MLTNPLGTTCVSASGCSLRAALQAADNRRADVTTINVPSGTYNLNAALGALQVGAVAGETVNIAGSSSPTVMQSAGCTETATLNCMVFFLDPGGIGGITVSISGLIVQGGRTANAGGGGGILGGSLGATPDTTTVSNCAITGNTATGGPAGGGGIAYAHGSLMVDNCAFNANRAVGGNGGGIDFVDLSGLGSALTVTNSSFSSNTATATLNGGGGAIHLQGVGSTYSVTGTLFNANSASAATAPGGGGAILKDSGTLTVTGSTFTGNSAGAAGAGGAINTSSDNTNLGNGTTPGLDRFVGNTAAAGSGQGLVRNVGNVGVVSAENNWWGANAPNTNDAAAGVPLTTWIVLGLSASPAFVGRGGSTTLTADLSHDNIPSAPSPGLIPTGPTPIPVAWPSATLGTLNGQTLVLDPSAHATATYTADGTSGTGTASVRVDGQTVTVDIPILFPPAIAKVFGGGTVPLLGDTTLTFNLVNPNSQSALTGVGFGDTLPAGLVLATPSLVTGNCGGGVITAAAGSSSISLSGATLAASGSCSFSVKVTGIVAGTWTNTTGNVASSTAGNGGTASASIDVVSAPTISKSFNPRTIALNATTSLIFTIASPAGNAVALTGVAFTDTLHAGLTVADTSTSVCGGTATTVAATGRISLSGATVAAGASCTFAVPVTGAASGTYVNTTGAVTSANGGTGTTSTDILVVASPPTIFKSFGAATMPVGGSTTLTFAIGNPNAAVTLNGVAFTDSLPAGLVVATPNGLTGSCDGGTITAAAGSASVSLSGATLNPSANCGLSIKVTGASAGVRNNSVSVTSIEGGPGNTSNATITVVGPPTISKAFGGASIPLNGLTTLTFTITNPNANTALTGVGFTDTLPAGLVVHFNGLAGACLGVVTAGDGSNSISLSGATIAPGGSCVFNSEVIGTTAGLKLNTTNSVTSTEGGAGGTASASIVVVAPPSIAKSFSPATIVHSSTTSLTFTITNPNATVALTGVAFGDTLPAGLSVDDSSAGICGGILTTVAASNRISLSGAALPGKGSCVFSVDVIGSSTGSYTNTTGRVTSTNGGTGNTASADLVVAGPPTIFKFFGAGSVPINGSTSLSFTIGNSNTVPLTGVAFTDSLPAGLVVASPNGVSGGCGGGTITATPGASTVSLGGATLAAKTNCTFSVAVTGTTAGLWFNSVQVTSTEGGEGNTSTTSLEVVGPPTLVKLFGAASIPLNGSTSLSFTISNPSAFTTVNGIGFSDTLPAGLTISTPKGLNGSCDGGTITANPGTDLISLAGANLASRGSCTFAVNVTGTAAGIQDNTTGNVTSTEGGNGGTASASIVVVAPPSIAKSFSPANIALNATTVLSFTITNPNATVALTGVAFTDTLPAGLVVASGTSSVCIGGTLMTTAPATISLSGASVAASSTCNFAVTITGAASGNYTNTTGAVTSDNGGTGDTASARLLVASPPTIVKSFSPTSVPLSGTSTLSFTINNPNSAIALTGVGFTDTLPSGLVVASPNGLSGGCGGGTVTAVAGSSSISLSGATLITAASCSFSINVTATTAGVQNNSVQVTSTEGGPGNTSNASLTVVAPPTISKEFGGFGAASWPLNQSITLTFIISNPNASTVLTGVGFSDTLPTGLVVQNASASECGGVVTVTGGSGSLSLSGATIAAGLTCGFSINVRGTTPGVKNNTTGNVTSTEGGTGGTASASIVIVAPPSITKAFSPANIALNGTTVLSFTIANPNATVTLSGVAFSDTLPTGLTVANGSSSFCGGGTLKTTAPTAISLSGGSVAAGSSCIFTVTVTGAVSGNYVNTTGAVTASNGGIGNTATANLVVASPATIVKSFGAASVPLNGSTTLSFTVANPNSTLALTGIAFTDSLPAGLVVANPNGLSGSCDGGSITAAAGSSSISLSGATLITAASCSFSVNVTGTAAGVKNNSVSVTSTEGGPGNTSSATLTVVAPPTLSKSFGAASIPLNGSTTLTFAINNPNTGTTLTGVGFSDTLPAGLVVSTPSGLGGTCGGGVIAATSGSNLISLSGGSIAASASCTVAVNVTGIAPGIQNNTTDTVTSSEGGTGGTASASIVVVAAPSIAKSFSPANIAINATTALSFTITNPAVNTVGLTGVAFTDGLPSGLTVASGSSSVCGGGTVTTTAPTTISLSGGSVAAGSSCTFIVNVTGTTSGSYTNVTGAVTSTNGGTGNTASANLEVASPPTIVKSFGAASVPLNGSTTLTFTINNLNTAVTLTGVAFADNLPAGLVVATPNGLSGSCGGGAIAAAAGGSIVSLGSATIAPSSSCAFNVNVTGTTAGVKNNSVSVTSTEGGPGNASNASITVVAPPTISKSFGAASIPLNGSTSLSFTITNPNASTTVTGIGFTDTLPAGLVVSSPNGLTGSCGGGSITALAGSNSVSLSGAALAASASCTFSVNVTGTTAGNKLNTAGALASNEGGTGGQASASIMVVAPPSISKSFGRSHIKIHRSTTLTFTITNPNTTVALTGVGFIDSLPAGLVVSTPNGLIGSCGGGTIVATAGAATITLSGATLPANSSCTFSVRVTGTRRGSHTNVTGAVTSTEGGAGNSASAHLRVTRGEDDGNEDGADDNQDGDNQTGDELDAPDGRS